MIDLQLEIVPKWVLKYPYNNYIITYDKRLYNTKTKRFIKKCVKKYSVGYNINGSFKTTKTLRHFVIKYEYSENDLNILDLI